jgi:hypothetical protein
MTLIQNLTTIVRDSSPTAFGDMAIDYGPNTAHHIWAEHLRPWDTASISSLPTQRAVHSWIGDLHRFGLTPLRIKARVPLAWQRDMIDPLPAEEITVLRDFLAEIAFEAGSVLQRRAAIDFMINLDGDGNHQIIPDHGMTLASGSDPTPMLDCLHACHSWTRENEAWLMQNIQALEFSLRVANRQQRLRKSANM